jgi:nucleoid-associated protein YgaU
MATADTTIPFELALPFTSPYKSTSLFIDSKGRAFFGIWQPLPIILTGTEEQMTVVFGQEGTLEFMAGIAYGDRSLWRTIAHANKIDFPLEQVKPGMQIIIPDPQAVRAALLAAASTTAGATS